MNARITLEVEPMSTIQGACDEAQAIADKIKERVAFQFNSVRCVAVPGGSALLLAELQQEMQNETPTVFSLTGVVA